MTIIISDTLVPSQDDAQFDADNPVIGWHNVVNIGNIRAAEIGTGADVEDDNHPATMMANSNTYQRFQQAVGGKSFYIEIEPNELDDIDYVAIAGHNWGTLAREVSIWGATERDTNDDFIFNQLVQEVIPIDDTPLIFRFTPAPYLALRIHVVATLTGIDDIAYAAVVYAGKLLILERKIQVSFVPLIYGRRSNVTNARSERGNFLGRLLTGEWLETSATFMWLSPDWYRTYMDEFLKQAQTNPFFFAWAPISYPKETGFAWLTDVAEPVIHSPTGHIQVTLNMQGIV